MEKLDKSYKSGIKGEEVKQLLVSPLIDVSFSLQRCESKIAKRKGGGRRGRIEGRFGHKDQ